ncbi:MAG: hypothetical protein ACRD4K_08035, partial [Candidatus Acidiferrales bacterium]
MRDTITQIFKQFGLGFLNFVVVLGLPLGIQTLIRGRLPDLAGLVILSLVVLAAYFAGSRWIEHRKPIEFESSRALPEMAAGIGIGIGLFSIVMGLLGAFGVYHFTGWGAASA